MWIVGHIYGYYDIRKQHSHRTKLSIVHIDDDSKLMFVSVHYVIPHPKMFYGDTVHESVMPPSIPNKIYWMKPWHGPHSECWRSQVRVWDEQLFLDVALHLSKLFFTVGGAWMWYSELFAKNCMHCVHTAVCTHTQCAIFRHYYACRYTLWCFSV